MAPITITIHIRILFHFRSGTEEDVTDLTTKLTNIISLIDDQKLQERQEKVAKSKKAASEKAVAQEIRDAAVSTVFPKRKGNFFKQICDFLNSKKYGRQ